MVRIVFVLLCALSMWRSSSDAAKLPSYVKGCSRHETNMNACALASARAAIPKFIHGDRKYRIPDLDPLLITRMEVDRGVLGLNLTMTNCKVFGLSQSVLEDIDMDIYNKIFARYQLRIPRVEVLCDYEVQGQILILPITGKGPGNITMMNMQVNFTYWSDLVKRGQHNYYAPKDSKLDFNTSRLYVKLDNLFNGNKLLGDQMNVFMDEQWRELLKDVAPIVGEGFNAAFLSMLSNIFVLVSFEESFPDKPPQFS